MCEMDGQRDVETGEGAHESLEFKKKKKKMHRGGEKDDGETPGYVNSPRQSEQSKTVQR